MELQKNFNNSSYQLSFTYQFNVSFQLLSYDDLTNKYFKINNVTGESSQIHNTGDFIKRFNANLTGAVGYKQRIQLAGDKTEYYPHQAKSLEFNKFSIAYTPKIDKLSSYAQFPNGRVRPFHNDEKQLYVPRKEKEKFKQIRKQLHPLNAFNSVLLSEDIDFKPEVSTLTGTVYDRNMTEVIPLELNQDLNATKIINGVIQQQPNESFLSHQLKKMKMKESEYKERVKEMEKQDKLVKSQLSSKINQNRYTLKTVSPFQTQKFFSTFDVSLPTSESFLFQTFHSRMENFHKSTDQLLPTITKFNTTTFDKSLMLNYNNCESEKHLFSLDWFDKKLIRQKKELSGYKEVQEKSPEKMQTKNRFNTQFPTSSALHLKDKALHKQMFPEMFEEKVAKRKRLFIDPITGKTLVEQAKVAASSNSNI